MSRFRQLEDFRPQEAEWELLPFRFERLNGRVLVTNMVGEHLTLAGESSRISPRSASRPTRRWCIACAPST